MQTESMDEIQPKFVWIVYILFVFVQCDNVD